MRGQTGRSPNFFAYIDPFPQAIVTSNLATQIQIIDDGRGRDSLLQSSWRALSPLFHGF
jgi:hypothetical protein